MNKLFPKSQIFYIIISVVPIFLAVLTIMMMSSYNSALILILEISLVVIFTIYNWMYRWHLVSQLPEDEIEEAKEDLLKKILWKALIIVIIIIIVFH